MAVIAYYTGFGFNRGEKVVMSLGIGTRNIAAVLIGVLTIPNVEPNMVAMVVIWTLWTIYPQYHYCSYYRQEGCQSGCKNIESLQFGKSLKLQGSEN